MILRFFQKGFKLLKLSVSVSLKAESLCMLLMVGKVDTMINCILDIVLC